MMELSETRIFSRRIILTKTKELRIIWALFLLVALIALGELALVDPFERLFMVLGFDFSWMEILKRALRILVVGAVGLVVLKYFIKKDISFVGLRREKLFRNILLGIGFGFVSQIVAVGIMYIMGWYEIIGFSWQYKSLGAILFAVLFAFVFCFETGFLEEFIFRGFVLNLFGNRYSGAIGVIVSSALFGVLHFSGFGSGFPWWLSVLSSFGAGLLFAQSYLLFRNLWVPIAFHAGWHFAMRFFGSPGLEANDAIFLITNVEGPSAWVATKSGGAGLVEIAGMVVVSLTMYFIKKQHTCKESAL
jgi:membrane protease YdiL (CAAX protease family)